MTWKTLAHIINNMSDEQKNTDVMIYDSEDDEFYAACALYHIAIANDMVLDANHPYLTIKENNE